MIFKAYYYFAAVFCGAVAVESAVKEQLGWALAMSALAALDLVLAQDTE